MHEPKANTCAMYSKMPVPCTFESKQILLGSIFFNIFLANENKKGCHAVESHLQLISRQYTCHFDKRNDI